MGRVAIKEEFKRMMEGILGGESADLLTALDTEPQVSIRYNPFKVQSRPEGEGVPWNRYGYYLDARPIFTFDPLFHAGNYYVQEAASMFVGHLLAGATDGEEGLRLLDLCAAPGGKTTLYSAQVGLEGLVVANEPVRNRAKVLAENVRKWGLGNVAVTMNDPQAIAEALPEWFDVVAVDAPCSGEGMFRKDDRAREEWTPEAVRMCAQRQRTILSEAWRALRPGGVLIYSTCTFNRAEDEEQVEWLTEEFYTEKVDIEIDPAWGITVTEAAGHKCYHFYPHRSRGEGLFAVVLRKGEARSKQRPTRPRRTALTPAPKKEYGELGRWVANPEAMRFATAGDRYFGYYEWHSEPMSYVSDRLNVIYSGVCMGQMFGGKLRPDHALALFHDLSERVARTELSRSEAMAYLRRESPAEIAAKMSEGIGALYYEGCAIGWAKRIGARINNMLPSELRVLTKESEEEIWQE